jgi:hypothetical protein
MSPTEHALHKLASGETPCNIAAALIGEVGPADLDGNRWRFRVVDGTTITDVDAQVSGSQGGERGQEVNRARLERAVEVIACGFDVDGRLAALVEHSPLTLSADDVGSPGAPRPWRVPPCG